MTVHSDTALSTQKTILKIAKTSYHDIIAASGMLVSPALSFVSVLARGPSSIPFVRISSGLWWSQGGGGIASCHDRQQDEDVKDSPSRLLRAF